MKKIIIACVFMGLAACGQKYSGTYTDQTGILEMTFKSSDKLRWGGMGMQTELDDTVDGDELKIAGPQGGTLIFTRQKDGSLAGMGVVLRKKEG